MADGKDDPSVSWEAQEGLGDIAVRQHQPVAAVRHFEAALDVVEKTRSDLLRTEFKLPFLTRLIRFYDEYVNTLADQKQFDRALAVADSSRAQALAERYESAPARRLRAGGVPRPRTPDECRSAVLLARSLALPCLGCDGSEIHHVDLPSAAQIEPLVANIRRLSNAASLIRSAPESPQESAFTSC